MVKNNHTHNRLENFLLGQEFEANLQRNDILKQCQGIASMYARIENSIAVLSDLSQNKSYIYYGALAKILGFTNDNNEQIESIWEDDIYSLVHPDDINAKLIQEFHFFRMLKKRSVEQRSNFTLFSTIRMRDSKGVYIGISHRIVYLYSQTNGAVWLVLCLYNLTPSSHSPEVFNSVIQNSLTGEIFSAEPAIAHILSQREIEILRLIEQGLLSKEIAHTLSLSINTINRHRQNIIEKLQVNSSIEAIRKARILKIIN